MVSGEFVIFLVLSLCGKNLKQRTDQCYISVLQLSFIWQAKENTSLRHECGPNQKTRREKPQFWLLLLYFISPSPSLPCVKWASQEDSLFYLRFSLPVLGPSFVLFSWAFPFLCLLATPILDFFFLF